jgi:sarcosine oxidase subunit beta
MYDFTIVGAGAYGCATAYYLAKAGSSVVVIDAGKIASGASGGLGKRGIRTNMRDPRELELMRQAHAKWPTLSDELNADTGFERIGGVCLVEDMPSGLSAGVASAKRRAIVQSDFGIPTEYWDQTALRDKLPGVAKSIDGALYSPFDGVASQEATTVGYARAAQRHGAVFIEDTQIEALVREVAGDISGVLTANGDRIDARRAVLLANNAGAARLVQTVTDYELPLWPVLPQVLLVKSEHSPSIPYLTNHQSKVISLKVMKDSTIMLSGGWVGAWDDDERSGGRPVQGRIEGNLDLLREMFPSLGELTLLSADTSRVESSSLDQVPFVDRIPGARKAYVATGWSGHGWALLPIVAQRLAAWLLTGKKPVEFDQFTIARLREARKLPAGSHR